MTIENLTERTRIYAENDCPMCDGKGEFVVNPDVAFNTSYVGGIGLEITGDGSIKPKLGEFQRTEIQHTPLPSGEQGVPCSSCLGSGVQRHTFTLADLSTAVARIAAKQMRVMPVEDWF